MTPSGLRWLESRPYAVAMDQPSPPPCAGRRGGGGPGPRRANFSWNIVASFKNGFGKNGLCAVGFDGTGSFENLPGLHDLWRAKLARLGAGRGRQPALHQAGFGGGDQFLRHRRHVFAGRQRGSAGPRREGFRANPRIRGAGDQGVFSHARWPQSGRAVAQAYPGVDRRLAETAGHRLCRPLSNPPFRSRRANGGNH